MGENFVTKALKILEERDRVREDILRITRDIVRHSRRTVMYTHLGNKDKASKALNEAAKFVEKIRGLRQTYPDLYFTGTVLSSLSEYSEALLLYRYVFEGELIGPDEVEVEPAAYLLGLSDLIGELRRYMLALIQKNYFTLAKRVLATMEKIYNSLIEVVLPEALVPGLRRKLDINRITIENSRKDLLFYERSYSLLEELEKVTSEDAASI